MYPFVRSLLLFPLVSLAFVMHPRAQDLECKNGGTLAKEGDVYFCVCPSPFTGYECEDYDCVHGVSTGSEYDTEPDYTYGKASESEHFEKRCLCEYGWTGDLCDKPLNINTLCGRNGEELDGECICHSGFVGDRCEYVSKCANGQLTNGRCDCNYGWSGDFCEKINCKFGKPDAQNQSCICSPKYRGRYCDYCKEASSSPPPECAPLPEKTRIDNDDLPFLIAIRNQIVMSKHECMRGILKARCDGEHIDFVGSAVPCLDITNIVSCTKSAIESLCGEGIGRTFCSAVGQTGRENSPKCASDINKACGLIQSNAHPILPCSIVLIATMILFLSACILN